MRYLCPSCNQEASFRRYLNTSTIYLTRPSSSFHERSPCPSHSHTLARLVLFSPPPFFTSPSTTTTPFLLSFPGPFSSSSSAYATTLIAILASSSASSVYSQVTPDNSLLILTTPNSPTSNPFFFRSCICHPKYLTACPAFPRIISCPKVPQP